MSTFSSPLHYFTGGAVGSAAGAIAWQAFGWIGVCAAGLIFAAIAGANHWRQ